MPVEIEAEQFIHRWSDLDGGHMRTHGTAPTEPIVDDANHVAAQDALLVWDGYPERVLKRDAMGRLLSDGEGRETYAYPNARLPQWPEADFIVGNPPFIGGKDIRARLGSGYVEALGKANPHVAPSADLVMHWWDRAAEILKAEGTRLRRFGFVTTNPITQVFQRRVVERHLTGASPISLVMAIPDHPWTKASKDAASVRIAMTVAETGVGEGVLRRVVSEAGLDTDEPKIAFHSSRGRINADLTVGADVDRAGGLLANALLCHRGVQLMGSGFIVTREEARSLGLGRRPGLERHVHEYRNGKDLTARSRDAFVIDLFGLTAEEVRRDFPEIYQHLLSTVKPERDRNARASHRDRWWVFGEPRKDMRAALQGLPRYIATVETAKHRVFQFLDGTVMPDNRLVIVATSDPFHLGVLSSIAHASWASSTGGTLEDRPIYTKSRCFDPFPFPEATLKDREIIAGIAEEIDRTRKLVLTEHPDLTLTALYNAIQAAKAGGARDAKARDIERRGRTLILTELHEQLDTAVLRAYGWPAALDAEGIVSRLVELNAVRAADERRGLIRWLREDYQVGAVGPLAHRADRVQSFSSLAAGRERPRFPNAPAERSAAVLAILDRSPVPVSAGEIADIFQAPHEALGEVGETLASILAVGGAQAVDGQRFHRTG